MHTPSKWKMTPERVSQFIKTYSFALMVDSEFEATHLPLVYKADEGENRRYQHDVTITGHLLRDTGRFDLVRLQYCQVQPKQG